VARDASSRWTPTGRTTRRPARARRPIATATADLVIGSRYVRGGGVVDWGIGRRVISRGGSLFARVVLGLGPHDLTGGFKAWRASTLGAIPFARRPRRRLRLPDRDDVPRVAPQRPSREVPITFRDRRVGQSKMSRRIVVEALVVVVQLRAEEIRGKVRGAPGPVAAPASPPAAEAAAAIDAPAPGTLSGVDPQ
jgi:hypothetical protein